MAGNKLFRWSIALCVLGTCCVQTRVEAQGTAQLNLLSAWGGPVVDFQRVGNIGYAAVGQKLVILDMTNESNVQELSSVLMTGPAESVAVRGNYLYVGGLFDRGRLVVVNITNPASPVVVWSEYVGSGVPPSYSSVQHLCFYNNILFAHNRDNGDNPVTYDITNPATPVALFDIPANTYEVRFFDSNTSTAYPPRDFQIVGDLAYVATRRQATTIAIFNMQPDPRHPTYVGRLTNTDLSSGYRISVVGNKAAVQTSRVSGGPGIRFVNVTNPASPTLANSNNDFGFARDVAIQGNLAFVADWAGGINPSPAASNWSRLKGLAIFDITNLNAPVLLGTYNTPHSSIREVFVQGNRAYALCDGQGLVVLDISNPANPTRIGGFYSPGQLRRMAKVGNLLYVADQWNGFSILDVSNPNTAPSLVGVYQGPGDITKQQHKQVLVRDNLAYLAAGNGGIQIVDVSNPMSPSLVFHYPTNYLPTGHVDSIELDGNILHTGQEEFEPLVCTSPPYPGFYNYDISNPRAISRTLNSGSGPYQSFACGMSIVKMMATKGAVTFAGLGIGETICLNESSGPGPILVTNHPWGGDDMEVHGDVLYIAVSLGGTAGLSVVNVTDPFQPTLTGFWTQTDAGMSRSIGVSGNRAFVGTNFWIDVLDISNPASPSAIARSPVSGAADILAQGNLCYSTYFSLASSNPAGSLLIRQFVESRSCGTADFNGDGDFGTDADIEAFFACLAGNCCATCYAGASDFNADGDFGTDADIEAFFRVLAGNPC